jgi:hypothetical protein
MSDEPKKRSGTWVGWGLIALLLVLYPLGFGPAFQWELHAKTPADEKRRSGIVDAVCAPLNWLGDHCAPLDNALGWYLAKFDDRHP